MKTAVKILKAWSIYSPGDIAGFDEERANSLVKSGIAELHKEVAKKDSGKDAAKDAAKDAGKDASKPTDPVAGK